MNPGLRYLICSVIPYVFCGCIVFVTLSHILNCGYNISVSRRVVILVDL